MSHSSDYHAALVEKNKLAAKKAKVIPTLMNNPDLTKEQMLIAEEEKLKAQRRLEEKTKSLQNRRAKVIFKCEHIIYIYI